MAWHDNAVRDGGDLGYSAVRRLVVDMATRMECSHDLTESDFFFFPLLNTLSPQLIITK
jgi:hypothetical protein